MQRHVGWKFPYRHPPPDNLIERTLFAFGSIFRSVGAFLDECGSVIQGPAGALHETVQPNLAWAPVKPHAGHSPVQGVLMPAPATKQGLAALKDIVMPRKGAGVFIAPNANVLGDVRIGDRSSIWYGATLRGDVNSIDVGDNTNIQDNVVVHVARYNIEGKPAATAIGSNVTIGHCATVHAASVGDNCLVGMGATLLDGVKMEPGSMVAAGAIVPPNTVIKTGQVWAGNPAKLLRELTPEEQAFIAKSAANYSKLADEHRFENGKTFEELIVECKIEVDRFEASDPINSVHQMWEFDKRTMLAVRARK